MFNYTIRQYEDGYFIVFEGDNVPEELVGKYLRLGKIDFTDVENTDETIMHFEYDIYVDQGGKLVACTEYKTDERKAIVEQYIGDFMLDIIRKSIEAEQVRNEQSVQE